MRTPTASDRFWNWLKIKLWEWGLIELKWWDRPDYLAEVTEPTTVS